MPQPPLNNDRLHLSTAVVDTATGIDVRTITEDTTRPLLSTTTRGVTHTSDNFELAFAPYASTGENVYVGDTFTGEGWAIPVADMDPTDTRCKAIIRSGYELHWFMSVTGTRTGQAPLNDTTGSQARASIWKYNPDTNTATFIAGGIANWGDWLFVLNNPITRTVQFSFPFSSDVVFERGEILFVQFGHRTGNLGNPLTGTTTYTFALNTDASSATSLLWAPVGASGLRTRCYVTPAGAASLTGVFADRRSYKRTYAAALALAGAYADRQIQRRTFVGAMALAGQRVTRRFRIDMPKTGVMALAGALDNATTRRRTYAGAMTLQGIRQAFTIRLGRTDLKGSIELAATVGRGLRKNVTAALALSGVYARRVTSRRTFTGTMALGAQWFVRLPQAVLNRMTAGGGPVINVVRRVIRIFED